VIRRHKLVVLGSAVAAQSRNKIQKRPYKVHIFYMSCARSPGGGGRSYCFSFLPSVRRSSLAPPTALLSLMPNTCTVLENSLASLRGSRGCITCVHHKSPKCYSLRTPLQYIMNFVPPSARINSNKHKVKLMNDILF
jgi:hypothetical protein